MRAVESPELKGVLEYILQAFQSRQELADFLRQSLDINLYAITESGDLQNDANRLVQALNQRGQILALVNALRSDRPDDLALVALLDELELSAASAAGLPTREMLADPTLDANTWRTRLGRLETQVCQVELRRRDGSLAAGTGLLVGPSHVLTAHSLLKPLLMGDITPGSVVVRFDFRCKPDGSLLHPGVEIGLAPDWRVAASPSSSTDEPAEDELDFILLRVQGAPGLNPVGQQTGGNGTARGFFTMDPVRPTELTGGILQLLFQPPGENPALVVTTSPDLRWNQNQTRLSYQVELKAGDTGAPVFDLHWNLVALHLGRAPGVEQNLHQGVPAAPIVDFLVAQGLQDELSGKEKRPRLTKDQLQERLEKIKTSRTVPARPAARDALWELREKVAVRAFFDLPDLAPPGRILSEEEQSALPKLVAESTVMTGVFERPVWMLRHPVRKETLRRLAGDNRLQQVLAENPASIPGSLQEMLEAYIKGLAPSLAMQTLAQLEATLQVQEWLAGCVDGLPTPEDVRRATARARMLAPFRTLVGDFFRGRHEELLWLRREAGIFDELPTTAAPGSGSSAEPPREFLPLQVYGPGGMGKSTLIAKFILEHAEVSEEKRFPYVYIDFNRQDLNIQDPVSILLEAVDQLEVQYPLDSALWQELRQEWLSSQPLAFAPQELASQKYVKSEIETRLRRWERYVSRFRSVVVNITRGERPFLMVLDTFEELLYHNREYLQELYQFILSLWYAVPRFVVLISGRAKIPWEYASRNYELHELSEADAAALLQARGLPDESTAMHVVNMVGRTPLALTLAADLYRRMEGDLAGLDAQESIRTYSVQVKDHLIEGLLYRRILGHIHKQDARVEKLAHPGLVLRYVTPELVLKVLAEPCGIEITTLDQARELVQRLREEDSLVEPDPSESELLRLRPELRHVMISLLKFDEPDQVKKIHTLAVAYFKELQQTLGKSLEALPPDDAGRIALERGLLRARADELYHRLMLGEDPILLDEEPASRLQEIADELSSAVVDLPPAAQTDLASRTKSRILVAEDVLAQASLATQERQVATSARNLIAQGQYPQAVDLLTGFAGRTPESPLYALHVQALTALGEIEKASQVLAEGITHAPPNSRMLRELLLLDAAGDEEAGRYEGAVESLQRALEISKRLNEPLARLQIQLDLYRWAQASPPVGGLDPNTQLDELREAWLAVDDQTLLQDPRLIRSAAAQVSANAPEIVRRALLLVGSGTIPPASLEHFASAVAAWDDEVSWSNRQQGMLARLISIPWREDSQTTWKEYFQQTPWAQAGEQIRLLVERHPLTTTMAITLADLLEAGVLLNSSQAELLQLVIVTGFTPAELDVLAQENLGISLSSASSRDTFAGQVADLINWAEANGRLSELLRGAALQRPSHPALGELLESLGLVSQPGSLDLNDPAMAIPYYQQALELAREQGNVPDQLASLAGLANAYFQQGVMPKALEISHQAADLARQGGTLPDKAYSLSDLAYFERIAGSSDAALGLLQEALAAAEESQDDSVLAYVLSDLAFEQRRIGDFIAAEGTFNRRLEVVLRLEDLQAAAFTLWDLGSIYLVLGRFQEERQAYERALEYIRKVGVPDTESSILGLLADNLLRLGEPDRAREVSQESVKAAERSGNEESLMRALDGQAYLLSRIGDTEAALAAYRAAIQSADRLGLAVNQSSLRISLSYQLLDMDQTEDAQLSLNQALEIAEKADEKTQMINALTALGNFHGHLERWDEAIQFYQKALEIAQESKDDLWQTTVLGILGGTYTTLEDYVNAEACYLQKIEIARQSGQPEREVEALGELAGMKLSAGDAEKYREYLEQQLLRARESGLQSTETYVLYQLGSDAINEGRMEEAIQYLQQSLQLAETSGDRQAAANVYFELGRASDLQGDLPSAREHLLKSQELFQLLDAPAAQEVADYLAAMESTGSNEGYELSGDFSKTEINLSTKTEKISSDIPGIRSESTSEATKIGAGRSLPLDAAIQQAAGAVGRGELQSPDGVRLFSAFLVGPDLILAPYDPLEQVLAGKLPTSALSFRFDFASSESNRILSQGLAYGLATGFKALWESSQENIWLMGSDAQLGYALLRLANAAGQDPRGGVRGAAPRGWLGLASQPRYSTDQFALLVHYPYGRQRTIDSSQVGFDRPSEDGRFIGYDFLARPGSEGAPVLNAALEVVAVHRYTMSGDMELNYGLTSAALVEDLRAKQIYLPVPPALAAPR